MSAIQADGAEEIKSDTESVELEAEEDEKTPLNAVKRNEITCYSVSGRPPKVEGISIHADAFETDTPMPTEEEVAKDVADSWLSKHESASSRSTSAPDSFMSSISGQQGKTGFDLLEMDFLSRRLQKAENKMQKDTDDYENDRAVRLASNSFGRARSAPTIPGWSPSASTPLNRPRSKALVSAWQFWDKAGKKIMPERDCWNDHFLTQRKPKKDPKCGPGEHCSNFMQSNVWSPKAAQYPQTACRTKCKVSELTTTGRWQSHHIRQCSERLGGATNGDAFARTRLQMSDGLATFAVRLR